jgi:hypothetical protein
MDGITAVTPDIDPEEMHHLWNLAIDEAHIRPGETVVILFSPGIYPLPHQGAFVYREEPTLMHVSEPGIEMQFRVNPITRVLDIKTVHRRAA